MSAASDISERAKAWREAGIIDAAQAERIVEFERGSTRESEAAGSHTRDRMQAVFGVLGALLVGLGVLATVIANWNSIGDLTKLTLLIGTMVVAYGIGLLAAARSRHRWIDAAAYTTGMLTFTGGVFIIAHMYNLETHPPLGLLLVAVFATALSLLSNHTSVGWIAAAAWLGYAFHEIALSAEDMADEGAAVLVVSASVLGALAAVALGWALAQRRVRVVGMPLRTLGTAALLLMLVIATFAWRLDEQLEAGQRPAPWVALAVAAACVVLAYRLAPLQHRRALVGALTGGAVVTAVLTLWPHDIAISIAASAALALGGIGLVWLGMLESRRELFGWGIAWLVLLVVTRYFDFMESVDLGGPGFIGAGVLLIGIAMLIGRSRKLWHQREEMLR